jgi:hypothetical protein
MKEKLLFFPIKENELMGHVARLGQKKNALEFLLENMK